MGSPSTRFLSFLRTDWAETFGSWNIVDVRDDQGLFQHGMVVGLTDKRLLVDFFCQGQPPRTVNYGRLFRFESSTRYISDADRIQVLLRTSKDLPFTWCAAKLLDADMSLDPPRLVKVEFTLNGAVIRGIVHSSQIRDTVTTVSGGINSKYCKRVGTNYFETGSCPVPDAYAGSFSEASPLWKICSRQLSKSGKLHLTGIHNGNLEFIMCGTGRQTPALERCLDSVTQHMESCLNKGLVWTGRFFARAPVTVLPDEQSESVQQLCLSSLPADLLIEIFHFSDSADRIRQRRVSSQWDAILRMEVIFKDIWMTVKYPYDCPLNWSVWDGLHAVVVAMTKLTTKSTKWMIITGSADSRPFQHSEQILGLVAEVARHYAVPGAVKLNLVISHYHWSPGYKVTLPMGMERLAVLCTQLTSVCDTLTWKSCSFRDMCVEHYCFTNYVVFVRKGLIKLGSPNLLADLWEMLNSNVPETDLEAVAHWLVSQTPNFHAREVECNLIMKVFHIPDPRLSPQSLLYQSDELVLKKCHELDVRRLTRLTLWALSVEMARTIRSVKRPLDESDEDVDESEEDDG